MSNYCNIIVMFATDTSTSCPSSAKKSIVIAIFSPAIYCTAITF